MTHHDEARQGSGEPGRAAGRLDDARDEQARVSERYEAAKGTPGELSAGTDLREAGEQVAAREAWNDWVQKDDWRADADGGLRP